MEIKEKREQAQKGGLLARLGSRKRLPLLIIGALLGVLLLLLGSVGTGEEESDSEDLLAQRAAELVTYEQALKKELATLCDAVSGVSHVEIFVSFESGYIIEYTADSEGDPTTVGSGSKEQALYKTVLPPRVSGVGIVCKGGENAVVRQSLTELVSAALGISSNRIHVSGR